MKKNRILALLLAVALLLLSGCAAKEAPVVEDVKPDEGAETEAVADNRFGIEAPGEPTEINFLAFRFPAMEIYAEKLKEMNEIENITTNTKFLPEDDKMTQVKLALSSNTNSPYQIMQITGANIKTLMAGGQLMPLNDMFEKYEDKYDFSDLSESIMDICTHEGNIYAIPTTTNTQHIFYRKDIFEELNLEPPTTVDELFETLEILKEAGKTNYPYAQTIGQTNGTMTEFVGVMNMLGGTFFDEDNNPVFNDEIGVKSIELLKDLVAYMPPSAMTFTNDDVMVALQTGEIAMAQVWTTRATAMEDETVSKVVGKIAYAPSVNYEEGGTVMSTVDADYFVLPKNTDVDPDLLFQILAQMTSLEAMTEAIATTPVTRSKAYIEAADVVESKPNFKAVSAQLAKGVKPVPQYPFFSSVYELIGGYVANAILEESTPQEALDACAKECVAELKSQGFIK